MSAASVRERARVMRLSRAASDRSSAAARRPSAVRAAATVSRSARMRETVAARVASGRLSRSMPTWAMRTPYTSSAWAATWSRRRASKVGRFCRAGSVSTRSASSKLLAVTCRAEPTRLRS